MEAGSHQARRVLTALESVRCLNCGSDYSKPARGGTAAMNPGCPECGYLGWQSIRGRQEERERPRSSEDPPQRRLA